MYIVKSHFARVYQEVISKVSHIKEFIFSPRKISDFMEHFFSGTVIKGLQKGREFGYKTINIQLINNNLPIENGVYAVTIYYQNIAYLGMLYIGTRPTLSMKEKTIEIHIFDFEQDIYGKQIDFQIAVKIREEIAFSSINMLVEQLHQDKESVKLFFRNQ